MSFSKSGVLEVAWTQCLPAQKSRLPELPPPICARQGSWHAVCVQTELSICPPETDVLLRDNRFAKHVTVRGRQAMKLLGSHFELALAGSHHSQTQVLGLCLCKCSCRGPCVRSEVSSEVQEDAASGANSSKTSVVSSSAMASYRAKRDGFLGISRLMKQRLQMTMIGSIPARILNQRSLWMLTRRNLSAVSLDSTYYH